MKLKYNNSFSLMRREYKHFYQNKYYNVWMSNYEIEGLDYQQNEYLFRNLWAMPSLASFIIKGTEGSTDYPKGIPCLCPYAPAMYNIYDYPTHCTLINKRGVKFIPSTLQEVDKDVILIWSNKARKSIYELLDVLFDRIALIECVIRINLNAHKVPFLLPIAPEDKEAMNKIWELIRDDSEEIFLTSEQFDKIKILTTGTNYILDKLYSLKDQVECEIREMLGFTSLPVMEKKEHLITSEVESNNDFVEFMHLSIKDMLEDWIDRFNTRFGTSLKLIDKAEGMLPEGEEEVLEDETA